MLLMHVRRWAEPEVAGPFSWKALLDCARIAREAGIHCQAARYSPAVRLTIREEQSGE